MPAAGAIPSSSAHARALALLRADPLRHIVTLKMIHVGGPALKLHLLEDPAGWGLLSLFSTQVFEYDQQTYADRDYVALIDGPSPSAKSNLLDRLPRGSFVVKTYDPAVQDYLARAGLSAPVRSFVSFTGSPDDPLPPPTREILDSTILAPDVAALFAANGYADRELLRLFADGARWFAIKEAGHALSACFVFRNFETVWEIGGVFTVPPHRRQGLARQVVAAALAHLHKSQLLPRYQVRADNLPSIDLARAAGLREFLRLDHFLFDREK